MTTDKDAQMRFSKKLIALSTGPLPPHVAVEVEACRAIDKLAFVLMAATAELNAAIQAPHDLGGQETAIELRQRWIASNLKLQQVHETVDASGKAVIQAVKVMLALE